MCRPLTWKERWQHAYDGICEITGARRLFLKRTGTEDELIAQTLFLEGVHEDLAEDRFGRGGG